ncbi:MAG: hypothetical protein HYW48_06305 [Deltaproteobacteria bacterium]|nr:hypothetical protein [Deltaproteobacteria bacterium]
MKSRCQVCQRKIDTEAAPFLCHECLETLALAPSRRAYTSLFVYNSPLRTLVLNVKINADYRALRCLTHLFLKSPRTVRVAQKADVIIPAPSSFWARARGRVDLAGLLASALAKQVARPLIAPPLSLRWEFRKRSKIGFREKREFNYKERDPNKKNALVVDDIVTTGHTFLKTSDALTQFNTSLLTIGDAYSLRAISLEGSQCVQ